MKMIQRFVMTIAMALLVASSITAAEWGDLKGRFVLKGDAPKLDPLDINKDKEFCGAKLPDPSIQVGDNKGLVNVAVWIYLDRGDDAPEVHPSYAEGKDKPVVVDNKDCVYVPHVQFVRAGQPVEFKNSDPIPHNFKVEGFANNAINNLVPVGGSFVHTFDSEERYPMNASCSIHGWMTSKLIVKDTPYAAVSGEDGSFVIKNLPVGDHKIQIWHEVPGVIKEVEVGGKSEKDRKGVLEVTVKPGENDLGDMVIDAKDLD